jgi:AcrR family transcriptional regulator
MAKAGTSSQLVNEGAGRSGATKRALVEAAIETLKAKGFSGTSARAIAEQAGCNQALVFYHFGSVANLLLAALDAVSNSRFERYDAEVEQTGSPTELVEAAAAIFREDLDAGYVTVLVEMIAGASSTPGLGLEVAARIAPWTLFASRAIESSIGGSALGSLIPASEVAYGVVALYLGLEMLTHLDGDRAPALALFDRAKQLAALFENLGALPASTPEEGT